MEDALLPPKRQVARSNRAEPTTSFNFQSVEEAACGEQERKRKRRHHPTGRETGGGNTYPEGASGWFRRYSVT